MLNVLFQEKNTLNGQVNRNNYRYWSDVNPPLVIETDSQTPQKVNVLSGILGNQIVH